MLKIKNLCFSFNDDMKDLLLENVNLSIKENGLYFIMGKSGSGKSTLLNLLSGFILPTSGSISYSDNDKVGLFFQDYKLFKFLNVEQNIAFVKILQGEKSKKAIKEARELLSKFKLTNLAKKKVNNLSGGEKARVSLLRLINSNTNIYLIDEATGELDIENGEFVMEVIKELSKSKICIFVTHNFELANKYGDKIYFLENKTLKCIKDNEDTTSSLSNKDDVVFIDREKYVLKRKEEKDIKRRNKKKKIKKINSLENFKFNLRMVKNRSVRIIFSTLFVSLSFVILTISLLFRLKAPNISNNIYNTFLNKNVATIYKNEEIKLNDKSTINKKSSLSENDIKFLNLNFKDLKIYTDISSFVPTVTTVLYKNEYQSILIEPIFDTNLKKYDEVIANKLFKETFKDDLKTINENVKAKFYYKDAKTYFYDSNFTFNIKHYVDDFSLLNIPTIYYDYNLMLNYLKTQKCYSNNASSFIYLIDAVNYLKEENKNFFTTNLVYYRDIVSLEKRLENRDFKIESYSLTLKDSFNELANSITTLISIFICVVIILTLFLQYISIYSLYEENKSNYAIVLAYDVNHKSYKYVLSNLYAIYFCISLLFYFIIYFLSTYFLNMFLKNMELSKIIYLKINPLLMLIAVICILLISFVSSYVSFRKIKKNDLLSSLRKE